MTIQMKRDLLENHKIWQSENVSSSCLIQTLDGITILFVKRLGKKSCWEKNVVNLELDRNWTKEKITPNSLCECVCFCCWRKGRIKSKKKIILFILLMEETDGNLFSSKNVVKWQNIMLLVIAQKLCKKLLTYLYLLYGSTGTDCWVYSTNWEWLR